MTDSKLRLLLIDDDTDMTNYLVKTLSPEYETLVCSNGLEALEKLNTLSKLPDGIILDVEMPVMNGIQFLNNIKETKFKHIPLIFLTAHQSTLEELKSQEQKIFLLKPISREDLKQILSDLFYKKVKDA